jgi:hypothetical protein
MKNPLFYKVFYMLCAGALLVCFFIDRLLGYGLIVGAAISYISTFLFNKQKESYSKKKQLTVFIITFIVKYVIIACLLYVAMRYSRSLFKGTVIGFVINQFMLLMEKIRAQKS